MVKSKKNLLLVPQEKITNYNYLDWIVPRYIVFHFCPRFAYSLYPIVSYVLLWQKCLSYTIIIMYNISSLSLFYNINLTSSCSFLYHEMDWKLILHRR